MIIAVDTCVSLRVCEYFERRRHTVMRAHEGELDEAFFRRVRVHSPDVYVSSDSDWYWHAMKRGRHFVRMSDGVAGKEAIIRIWCAIRDVRRKLPPKYRFWSTV